ncbi:hypothetical protein GTP44_01095 [Duganella sp. FT50W]|uniref:Uncharacterized protein n=1 Tax=Duganella lactea TaxID=2692173 RepID=A0A6L8MFV1_9BURK|nr:hypothetical protein [Duganella lactea]MYM80556.1 hypothetical protein [Duganella lactea]
MKFLYRVGQALQCAGRALIKFGTFCKWLVFGGAVLLYFLLHVTITATKEVVSHTREVVRMIEWLLVAALFYWLATQLPITGHLAAIQTLLWKLGHVTLGGFIGYWLDRMAFRDRMDYGTPPMLMMRRAVIMAASMFTLGTGL